MLHQFEHDKKRNKDPNQQEAAQTSRHLAIIREEIKRLRNKVQQSLDEENNCLGFYRYNPNMMIYERYFPYLEYQHSLNIVLSLKRYTKRLLKKQHSLTSEDVKQIMKQKFYPKDYQDKAFKRIRKRLNREIDKPSFCTIL